MLNKLLNYIIDCKSNVKLTHRNTLRTDYHLHKLTEDIYNYLNDIEDLIAEFILQQWDIIMEYNSIVWYNDNTYNTIYNRIGIIVWFILKTDIEYKTIENDLLDIVNKLTKYMCLLEWLWGDNISDEDKDLLDEETTESNNWDIDVIKTNKYYNNNKDEEDVDDDTYEEYKWWFI